MTEDLKNRFSQAAMEFPELAASVIYRWGDYNEACRGDKRLRKQRPLELGSSCQNLRRISFGLKSISPSGIEGFWGWELLANDDDFTIPDWITDRAKSIFSLLATEAMEHLPLVTRGARDAEDAEADWLIYIASMEPPARLCTPKVTWSSDEPEDGLEEESECWHPYFVPKSSRKKGDSLHWWIVGIGNVFSASAHAVESLLKLRPNSGLDEGTNGSYRVLHAKPIESLRQVVISEKLKGNERYVIQKIYSLGGSVPLAKLAREFDWMPEFKDYKGNWNTLRGTLNEKLKPHGWKLITLNKHAVAEAIGPSAGKGQ